MWWYASLIANLNLNITNINYKSVIFKPSIIYESASYRCQRVTITIPCGRGRAKSVRSDWLYVVVFSHVFQGSFQLLFHVLSLLKISQQLPLLKFHSSFLHPHLNRLLCRVQYLFLVGGGAWGHLSCLNIAPRPLLLLLNFLDILSFLLYVL